MNKKIIYKLLLIFVLLTCILFISNTKSFATDETTTRTSLSYTSTNGYTGKITDSEILSYNILFIQPQNSTTKIFFTKGQFVVYPKSGDEDYIYITCVDESGSRTEFYYLEVVNSSGLSSLSSKTINDFSLKSAGSNVGSTYDFISDGTYTLSELPYYSDYNVYSFDENNVLTTIPLFTSSTGAGDFFQVPPVEQTTTLAPIVEEMETEKTLAEIVAILPVVLVVIVGLLAMRKAIRFLMRILKQG